MFKIDYVTGEDWAGLYFNGELVDEGRSFSIHDVFSKFNIFINDKKITVKSIDVNSYEINQEWLENKGSMPKMFADIPENMFK